MVSFNFERFTRKTEAAPADMLQAVDDHESSVDQEVKLRRLKLEQGHMMRLLGEADVSGPGVVSSRESNELRDTARMLADRDMKSQESSDSQEELQQ